MYARSKAEAGFTIVETLIFLAISGLMFVLAINAMSGKQQQTEFQTGVGTLKSELNQVLSNVSDGNYNTEYSGSNYQCSGTSGLPQVGTAEPLDGTCTAIGEVVEFGAQASGGQQYYTVPVFGCAYAECATGGSPTTDISGAYPRVDAVDGIYQTSTMPFGLTINTGSVTPPGAFGIFSFTTFSGGGSDLSGSSHVELFAIPGLSYKATNTPTDVASYVNTTVSGHTLLSGLYNCGTGDVCTGVGAMKALGAIDPTAGISFCVQSGTSDDKSALFTIGGSSDVSSVTDTIFNGASCS